ncbi:MAG: hypothetical protein ACLPWS_09625 [Rhodomicrobium sp.]
MNILSKVAIATLASLLFMGGVRIAIDSLYPSGKSQIASTPVRTMASAADSRK